MEHYNVNLGDRSYPILLGAGISSNISGELRSRFPGAKFALVTNETLVNIYQKELADWSSELPMVRIAIPDGEQYKTIDTWRSVLDSLLGERLDRKTVIVAFGGGVVGDIAGFAAASFLRGVKYVQIPSTLLAMVDSSVGGKTAVDHKMGKNLVGAFHQPSLVLVDTTFLETLPRREFIAGYAELFKYSFIGGSDMVTFVSSNHKAMVGGDNKALVEGIRRSLAIKARVVESDEREETGARAVLNFGHTFAHAIERFYNFSGILHGEAVLWGIACACDLGLRVGTIPQMELKTYGHLLEILPRVNLPWKPDPEKLYEGMFYDKKVEKGKVNFVLPTEAGSVVIRNDITQEAVLETLNTVFGI
jgi:3-dehydroquinate synthase